MTDPHSRDPDDEALLDALRRTPAPLPPDNLTARFRERLAAEPVTTMPSRPARRFRWLPAVAAALILLLGAGWLIEGQRHRRETTRLRHELEIAWHDLSAARRLVAVIDIERSGLHHRDLTALLARVVLTDSNATVRVAAVEALARLADPATLARTSTTAATHEESVFVLDALLDAAEQMSVSDRMAFLRTLLARPHLTPIIRAGAEARLTS